MFVHFMTNKSCYKFEVFIEFLLNENSIKKIECTYWFCMHAWMPPIDPIIHSLIDDILFLSISVFTILHWIPHLSHYIQQYSMDLFRWRKLICKPFDLKVEQNVWWISNEVEKKCRGVFTCCEFPWNEKINKMNVQTYLT